MREFTAQGLMDTFPPSLRGNTSLDALAGAISDALAEAFQAADCVNSIGRVDQLDESMLNMLAEDLDIVWWDPDGSLLAKRTELKTYILMHKALGTRYALERVVQEHINAGPMQDWWQYGGKPFHFRVTDLDPDDASVTQLLRVIDNVKRLSTVLDKYVWLFLVNEDEEFLTDENGILLTL